MSPCCIHCARFRIHHSRRNSSFVAIIPVAIDCNWCERLAIRNQAVIDRMKTWLWEEEEVGEKGGREVRRCKKKREMRRRGNRKKGEMFFCILHILPFSSPLHPLCEILLKFWTLYKWERIKTLRQSHEVYEIPLKCFVSTVFLINVGKIFSPLSFG